MQEFKVLLFIIEKEFWKSQTVEFYLKGESHENVEQYLKDTIKKEYHIKELRLFKE
jgi:hypothetical protein